MHIFQLALFCYTLSALKSAHGEIGIKIEFSRRGGLSLSFTHILSCYITKKGLYINNLIQSRFPRDPETEE